MQSECLVSVRLQTYNQNAFILLALNSIIDQKELNSFEIVIGDDCSTDGTTQLIKDFISNYSSYDFFNLLIRDSYYKTKRLKSGRLYNFTNIIANCNGKYIALLDGDDYWIDEHKLQKQVDFLEANPNFSICFSRVQIVDADGQIKEISNQDTPEVTTFKDLLKGNYLNTPSVMIRRDALPNPLPEWLKKMPMGDWPLLLLASLNGDIKMFPEPMAAYRIHSNGVWSTNTSFQKLLVGFKSRRILLENLPAKAHPILLHSTVGNALYISSHYRENGQRLLGLKYFCFYLYYRLIKWSKK